MVGTPPDPAELRFAACRVLPRHQADPRRQFTAGAEAASIVDRGYESGSDDRPDTGQHSKPSGRCICAAHSEDPRVEFLEPMVR
jgi:hypothetical protein